MFIKRIKIEVYVCILMAFNSRKLEYNMETKRAVVAL